MAGTARKTRGGLIGPGRRWFGHPAIIASVVALLLVDYWSIPGGGWRRQSTVKRAVSQSFHALAGRAHPTVRFANFPAYFFEKGGQIELVWAAYPTIEGQITLAEIGTPGCRVDSTWTYLSTATSFHSRTHGFYHPVRHTESFEFREPVSEAQRIEMMRLFVERFDTLPRQHELVSDPWLQRARAFYVRGETSKSNVLWIGHVRNSLAFVLAALLGTLPLRGRTDLWLRRWRDRLFRRTPSGHCLRCGYDLAGLTRCPECGAFAERAGD